MNPLNHIIAPQTWAILPAWFSQAFLSAEEGQIQTPLHLSQSYPESMTQNATAILPISGVILPQANIVSQLFGATTLDKLTHDFQKALDNPAISEIILHIDSPGGVVTGVHECADLIYHARGKKPITAYVSGLGASAAYWLASACNEIVIDATASVGSIGVLSVHTDDKQRKASQGLSQIQIVSSQSPRKRLDVATEAGRAEVQAQVDAIADVFVANVARNRNVSIETVLADFGQGSLLVGEQAVKFSLADRLGSLQQLIEEKSAKKTQTPKFSYQLPREQTMTDMLTDISTPKITADYLIEHHADCVRAFNLAGAQQERERIQAVENQLIPGHEALIKQLKFDGKTTGAEAAVQVLAAEKARREANPNPLQQHALQPLPITRSVVEEGIENNPPKKVLSFNEQCQADWQKDSALQAEFSCFEAYVAFAKAEQNGQVNILNRAKA